MADISTKGEAEYDWRAGILAGVMAGLAFLFFWMAFSLMTAGTVWLPYHMIASIALGPETLPATVVFDAGTVLVALVIHFILSVLYASLIGLFVRGRALGVAFALGAAFGGLLYVINFYVFTGVFPWFALVRNWATFMTHIIFGGIAGAAYTWIAGRVAYSRPVT